MPSAKVVCYIFFTYKHHFTRISIGANGVDPDQNNCFYSDPSLHYLSKYSKTFQQMTKNRQHL